MIDREAIRKWNLANRRARRENQLSPVTAYGVNAPCLSCGAYTSALSGYCRREECAKEKKE